MSSIRPRGKRNEAAEQPGWLVAAGAAAARRNSVRDKALLDLLPVGVLIYRLDRLVYANSAFLKRMGYASLHALEEAGGLDALYVERRRLQRQQHFRQRHAGHHLRHRNHRPNTRRSRPPTRASTRITWDGDSALALIFSGAAGEGAAIAAAIARSAEPIRLQPEHRRRPASAGGHANAEELGAILDTTAEGIVMFDAEGKLNSCNRSAEALFGYDGDDLVQRNLDRAVRAGKPARGADYLESIKGDGVASLLDHGREVLGRAREGGLIPLSMTMGRTQADGPNFFAVFRDLSQARKSEANCSRRGGWPIARSTPRPTCWRGSATRSARRSTPSSALPK